MGQLSDKGSDWGKWDLHFHTPSSYDYKNKSITDQQLIDGCIANSLSVVAITDHHIMDISRIKNLQKLARGKVTILPGIEFLCESRGDEPIHFIGLFSESADINFIWKQLESCTNIKKIQGDQKKPNEIYCDLEDTVKVIKERGGIITIHAGSKSNSIENITHALPHGTAQKEDIAKMVDIFELGQPDDITGYSSKVLPHLIKQIGKKLPLIICSDNHDIANYSTKANLWIKAEPTFDGLRQILYEPDIRVHIGEKPPINPPIRINKVVLDFPDNAQLSNEAFCLAGKREINFSPNLTCIIGGRGTGKSTLLNLIHERLKIGENKFFSSQKIFDKSGKIISISEAVHVDEDKDEKYVEYFSQNEIEEFARDLGKLTKAIYTRILKRDETGNILQFESQLTEKLDEFRTYIVRKRKNLLLKQEISQKEKEVETYKKIIDSFSSDIYTGINNDVKELTAQYNLINHSKNKYTDLVSELQETIKKYDAPKQIDSAYSNEIAKIVSELKKLIDTTITVDFSEPIKETEEIVKSMAEKDKQLNAYLQDKGLTEENRKDISSSSKLISISEDEIKRIKLSIKENENFIEAFQEEDLYQLNNKYKTELEAQIEKVGNILKKIDNKSIKPITLKLSIDENALESAIFEDFKKMFEGQINKNSHKGDSILKDILFTSSPKEPLSKDSVLTAIRNNNTNSAARPFLLDLLEKDENYESYDLIVKRQKFNLVDFKQIKVEYDGRFIRDSSFGQRCTAVLVILLLLGNNPIIIDEPEAHLDSFLISTYLVDLIKDKKQNRQIIFATHNANFVINGDAEFIHILDFDDKNKMTRIRSTTIENESTREDLIGLEGGLEAFKKREDKYFLNRP